MSVFTWLLGVLIVQVVLELDVRVSYQIQDVDVFAANPIDFYPYIRNFIQNELLDAFARCTLREYMSSFSSIAQGSAAACSEKQVSPVCTA